MFCMTLKKIAKRVTSEYTYFAYAQVNKGNVKYYWRNPYNNELLPITIASLKKWERVLS